MALPQAAVKGVEIQPWRRDPIMAFIPSSWTPPSRITPAWLAARALILNDSSTQLSRVTSDWFATAGLQPDARIELNYNDAVKSLVAAGYGATLLPHEARSPEPDPRLCMRPLRPGLWRHLGIASRQGQVEQSTAFVLQVLLELAAQAGR
ncbi:LysR substrate binding domain protein [compost metagenome]